jgi:hypothetical protein
VFEKIYNDGIVGNVVHNSYLGRRNLDSGKEPFEKETGTKPDLFGKQAAIVFRQASKTVYYPGEKWHCQNPWNPLALVDGTTPPVLKYRKRPRVTAFGISSVKIGSQAWPALTGTKPLPDARAGHAREKQKIDPNAVTLEIIHEVWQYTFSGATMDCS